MITLTIKPRGRPIEKLPPTVELDLETTTTKALHSLLSKRTGLSRNRLRLTKSSDGNVVAIKKDSGKDLMVKELGLREGSTVFVKDLGPQIAWATVFVIEYLGPILIHPLVLYVVRPYVYSSSPFNPLSYLPFGPTLKATEELAPPTQTQHLLCALIVLHFIKRECETLFVHRFSSETMPVRNIFKNCAHYWIVCGVNLAYSLYAPDATPEIRWYPASLNPETNPTFLYAMLALWLFAQISNFKTHIILRNLRPANGSTKRQIPRGYGFDSVTCPNYSFEILSWITIWALSGGSWAALLFILIGVAQMFLWAQKKEMKYRKEFGNAYRRKNLLVPGIL